MRLREDLWWDAGAKRAILFGALPDPRTDDRTNWDPLAVRFLNDDSFEAAVEGDVWEIRRSPVDGKITSYVGKGHEDWVLTGYGLWCPNEACEYGVHLWTHASNCMAKFGGACKAPKPEGQVQSCWTWTGSIARGDLTASPSLFVDHKTCGWHGYLQGGAMSGAIDGKYAE